VLAFNEDEAFALISNHLNTDLVTFIRLEFPICQKLQEKVELIYNGSRVNVKEILLGFMGAQVLDNLHEVTKDSIK
jgi:hypothetical protein